MSTWRTATRVSAEEREQIGLGLPGLLSRLFTWGLPDEIRRDHIAEADAHWEAMVSDLGNVRVALHAIRSIPAWLWDRLSERDTTTLPAALAVAVTGFSGARLWLYPLKFGPLTRTGGGIAVVGLLMISVAFMIEPRKIVLRRFRFPALVAAIGLVVASVGIAVTDDWSQSTFATASPITTLLSVAGLVFIGFGCVLGTVNGFILEEYAIAFASEVAVVLGLALLGVSQIAWGLWEFEANLGLALAFFGSGLGALAIAHVLPRIRHLEVE